VADVLDQSACSMIREQSTYHSNLEGVVTSDGSWLGSEGVGGTEHLSASLDGIKTLPNHTDNGAGKH
jgi:hypothetical protein